MDAPNGLTVLQLQSAGLDKARNEAEEILRNELSGQIASNQHCFINLPFPLTSGNREAVTPTFAWSDSRVAALAAVVEEAFVQLGFTEKERADMRARANVIVREYRRGQAISFHVDELECSAYVVGIILLNECDKQRGLMFVREERKYVLEERCGTTFLMRDEARYAWKHGLLPCTGRRISVTVRFFKRKVLDAWVAAGSQLYLAPPRDDKIHEGSESLERVRVVLIENSNFSNCKSVVLASEKKDLKAVLKLFNDKLRVKAKVVFVDGELWDGNAAALTDGCKLYGGRAKEAFTGKAVPKSVPATTVERTAEDEVAAQIVIWEGWRYPKLSFCVEQLNAQLSDGDVIECLGPDTALLGSRIAESHLSVPETRELVLALQKTVEDEKNGFQWGFHSKSFEDGRSTTVALMQGGRVIAFTVEGAPPLKGARKADGPLWQLQGGLNNPVDHDPNFFVEPTPAKTSQHQPVRGSWADKEELVAQKRTKSRKTMYQSKRGVVVTESLVGFAGTVWCSSYFLCPVQLDGQEYTSSAHAVMVQQAMLFGDRDREDELRLLGHDAAPHKAFDHKAPKTGVRKLASFDKDVWERFRVRIMFRSTFAKFSQNAALKQRMLQCCGRTYVEATSDPMWGCGILLSNSDWQKRKCWTGPNLMGSILTAVSRLLHAEEHGANRRQYLQSLPEWNHLGSSWRRDCAHVIEANLEPRFPPPHWPGVEALRRLANQLDEMEPDFAESDPGAAALTYCLETCLGLRV